MRAPLSAAVAALGLLSPGAAPGGPAEVLQRVSESLVKIEAGESAASGFLWSDGAHAVTSLHVVDGKQKITAHYVGADGKIVASTKAVVEKVLQESDLVLLRLVAPQDRKPLAHKTAPPTVKQSLDALGFPLNVASYSNIEVKVRFGGNQLRTILPQKVLARLTSYPSTSLEILNLEGNLVPGLSGAPIVDGEGRVVGVADGGLEEGAIGICWGIPASQLERLAQSTVSKLPGSPRIAELFAADLQPAPDAGPTPQGSGLTKLRVRTFQQLAATADDKLGLAQLASIFQMFNPNAFRYDVYQDVASGATVAIPEGATLSTQDDFIVVSLGDDRMSMKLQIAALASPAEAQLRSVQFEQALVGPVGVAQSDGAWSYLLPVTRSGITVLRKGIYHGVFNGFAVQPDKYYFETLATNGKSLLGVAAVNDDSSTQLVNLEAMCGAGLLNARCPELVRSRRIWAQMVLGVQFSSFPPQF